MYRYLFALFALSLAGCQTVSQHTQGVRDYLAKKTAPTMHTHKYPPLVLPTGVQMVAQAPLYQAPDGGQLEDALPKPPTP